MYLPVEIADWGGLNEDENADGLANNELTQADNVWRLGSTLATRPGTRRDGAGDWDGTATGTGAGDACQGAAEVSIGFDATKHRIAIFDGEVYNAHDNTMDKTTNTIAITAGGSSGDNYWTFAQMRGSGVSKLYAVGGAITTPDDFWSWPIALGAATPLLSEAAGDITWGGTYPGARFLFPKWNRLFINGMDGTGTDDGPMIGRYCELGNGDEWPQANTIGGVNTIGALTSDGSEFSTGWGEFESNRGDWLLFLTNRALYPYVQGTSALIGFGAGPIRWSGDRIATGCVSQRAFVNLGTDAGDAIYLSDKGVHSLRQSQAHGNKASQFLSWKIRNTFKTLNFSRLKFASGVYDEENGYVLFAVSTGSELQNNLILALDIRDADADGITAETARWYLWRTAGTDHRPALLFSGRELTGTDEGRRRAYMATYDGNIVQFNDDVYADLGSAYQARMRTKHFDMGRPGRQKVAGDTVLWVGPRASYSPTLTVTFDFGRRTSPAQPIDMTGDASVLGTMILGQDPMGTAEGLIPVRLYSLGAGETISHQIQHSGGGEPFRVGKIVQDVDVTGEGNKDAA